MDWPGAGPLLADASSANSLTPALSNTCSSLGGGAATFSKPAWSRSSCASLIASRSTPGVSATGFGRCNQRERTSAARGSVTAGSRRPRSMSLSEGGSLTPRLARRGTSLARARGSVLAGVLLPRSWFFPAFGSQINRRVAGVRGSPRPGWRSGFWRVIDHLRNAGLTGRSLADTGCRLISRGRRWRIACRLGGVHGETDRQTVLGSHLRRRGAALYPRRASASSRSLPEGRLRMIRRSLILSASLVCALCVAVPALAGDVSVGSPPDTTPQNHQNEPAVAIDAHNPNFAVAGWNDFVDWAPCPQADALQFGTCADPADDGVGLTAVAYSFDRGHSWIQPTYTGWTANDCDPTTMCTAHVGSIHTLPWYFENRLVSSGDPAVAVGPIPVNGRFAWANGSRVYYANLVGAWPSGFAFPNPEF